MSRTLKYGDTGKRRDRQRSKRGEPSFATLHVASAGLRLCHIPSLLTPLLKRSRFPDRVTDHGDPETESPRPSVAVDRVSGCSRPMTKSPRLHLAGDVPPELSPLDAFALHSRLARETTGGGPQSGNRVSRLPPLTTSSPYCPGPVNFFRSMSQESARKMATHPYHKLPA